jgi:hypothetical protein
MNLQLLVGLGAGHVLGDFVLQTRWMVKGKKDWRVRCVHVAIVVLVSYVLAGFWSLWWLILPGLMGIHFAIDTGKVRLDRAVSRRGSALLFAVDQGAHVVSVILLTAAASWWRYGVSGDAESWWVEAAGTVYLRALILVTGFVLAVRASGLFLAVALRRREGDRLGPERASGFSVGLVERALIFTSVLAGSSMAVFLVLLAKAGYSMAGGRWRHEPRRALLGSMASFALGLVVSVATRYAILAVR